MTIVTQGKWVVAFVCSTGQPGVTLNCFIMRRVEEHRFKIQRGDGDERHFPDMCAAQSYALVHGYIQPYYRRAV
jgi:hypothetical protein